MRIEKASAVNLMKSSNDIQKNQSFGRLQCRKPRGLTEEAFIMEACSIGMPVDTMSLAVDMSPEERGEFLRRYKDVCEKLRELFQKNFL